MQGRRVERLGKHVHGKLELVSNQQLSSHGIAKLSSFSDGFGECFQWDKTMRSAGGH